MLSITYILDQLQQYNHRASEWDAFIRIPLPVEFFLN